MKRRTFIRTTAAASLAICPSQTLYALEAENAYRKNLGIQLYTLRNELAKDPAGTLKKVAELGYRQVELYGFPNSDPLVSGAKDAGLEINSAHFEWDTVVNPKDAEMSGFAVILEKAHKLGLGHLVIPYLKEPNRATLDDYRKVAENANKAAAMAKKAGIRLSYHNHSFEFEPKEDGKSGYDVLMAEFSLDMRFEVDVFWVKVAGLDPVALIGKLHGRVTQLHLKDLKEGVTTPSFATPLPEDSFQPLGAGIIPMEPVIVAAKAAGVEHCHVEQDQSPAPLTDIGTSMAHLRKL